MIREVREVSVDKSLSIKEIADLAGVSVATISRVMNKKGGYSAQTERKVKEVIKKYEYMPNLTAKSLRTNQSRLIGLVVPDIANEYFAKLVLELQVALFSYDYLTMVCNVNESPELEQKHIKALIAQNVSGLILISDTSDYRDTQNIPTVYIDRRPMKEGGSKTEVIVESDNVMGGYLATRELIEHGCKKIAFLTDLANESSKIGRYEGYCKALAEAAFPITPALIMRVKTVNVDDALAVIAENLRNGLEFDGVVCTTDSIAIGTILALRDAGKFVPEDVKVTGFDDVSVTTIFKPSLTSVHQYGDLMAKKVADLMMDLINGRPIEIPHHIIPVKLVPRESTRG